MTLVKAQCVCLNCEKTFEAGKKTAKFCSKKCRDRCVKECEVCGGSFESRRQDKTKTCSDECRATRNKWPVKGSMKACEACGEQFEVKNVRFSRTCNRKCAAALRIKEGTNSTLCVPSTWEKRLKRCIANLNATWRNNLVQCEQCGRHRTTSKGRCKQCIGRLSSTSLNRIRRAVQEWLLRSKKKCKKCERTAEWWSSLCSDCNKTRDRQKKRQSRHKARCRAYGCEYQSGIKLSYIIERDGRNCHYCAVVTTRNEHNADTQAEMDHVIPISKGGGHVIENIVVSCRKCNNAKADKILACCEYG